MICLPSAAYPRKFTGFYNNVHFMLENASVLGRNYPL